MVDVHRKEKPGSWAPFVKDTQGDGSQRVAGEFPPRDLSAAHIKTQVPSIFCKDDNSVGWDSGPGNLHLKVLEVILLQLKN